MSTALAFLCVYVVGVFWFIVLLNPLSMFFFNLFNPRFAAELANDEIYCGDTIRDFYTKLALKWPLRWAVWWIRPEQLGTLTLEQQIGYYRKVNNSKEALMALGPKAWVQIIKDMYPDEFNFLGDELKKRDDLFAELLDVTCAEQKKSKFLHQYMEYGTLPKAQMAMLVEKACIEAQTIENGCVARILCDYIERCGTSHAMLEFIANDAEVPQALKDAVADSNNVFVQRVTTRRLHDLSTIEEIETWADFCAPDKKICALAQMEMSPNQYGIFHKKGHSLDAEAIAHLLWYGNADMAELIFRMEPKFGILDDTIEFSLDKHEYLRPLLQKVITEVEADLRKRINNREELSVEQLNKVFDCPDAGDMMIEYLSQWPLPQELHKRILESEDGARIIYFYNTQGLPINEDVRNEAEDRGWLERNSTHIGSKLLI